MDIEVTSGFIPMPELPAAQLPKLRVYVTNLENQEHHATIQLYKLQGGERVQISNEAFTVPGDERQIIEVETDVISGQFIEVVAKLPRSAFLPEANAVAPSVAVVSEFIGDGSTSLLQFVSAGAFESVRPIEFR